MAGNGSEEAVAVGLISPGCCNEELAAFNGLLNGKLKAAYVDTFDGRHYRNYLAVADSEGRTHEARWQSLLEADLVFYCGASPLETHPIVAALTRKVIMEKAARLMIVAEKNDMAPWEEVFVPASGSELELFLEVLAAELGSVSASSAKKSRLSGEQQEKLAVIVRAFRESSRPVIVGRRPVHRS